MRLSISNFDLVIPVAGKDCLFLRRNLNLLKKNINPDKIYIITNKRYFVYFINLGRYVKLINEDLLINCMTFDRLSNCLLSIGLDRQQTGWYFQQFLKMGFALSKYATNRYYLTWDADTMPLNKVHFFDNRGKPFFTLKEEYHKPYFITINRMLNLDKQISDSFISENMLFDVKIMTELISKIQSSEIEGKNWYEKIIKSLPKQEKNGFSEFETYGTYVLNYYPEKYSLRKLTSYRDCGLLFSRSLIKTQVNKLSRKYTIISLEHKDRPKSIKGLVDYFEKSVVFIFNKLLLLRA